MNKSILAKVLFYLIGIITVASYSFYNGFPFINGDTSSYINAAWEDTVPFERPVFYGWFLKITSLGYSLWISILSQCLICFIVVKKSIEKFSQVKDYKAIFLATVLTLLLTHLGWEANKLLPDVFAGLSVLLILLFLESKSIYSWFYLIAVILLGTFHNSHFVLFALLAVIGLLLNIRLPNYSRLRLLALLGCSIASYSLVSLANYIDHGEWQLGRSSEVFMVGQMAESGILQTILNDECEDADLALCKYKDSLPNRGWKYVSNGNSPVAKLGGWGAMEKEHKKILRIAYGTPKYWSALVTSSVIRGLTTCFQLEVGDGIFRYETSSNIQQSIKKYYSNDSPAAQWNKQTILTIPFQFFTIWHLVVLVTLTVCSLYFWYMNRLTQKQLERLVFCLIAIVLNGWTVAQFANVADRLNTRIFWILPFIMILTIWEAIRHNRLPKEV